MKNGRKLKPAAQNRREDPTEPARASKPGTLQPASASRHPGEILVCFAGEEASDGGRLGSRKLAGASGLAAANANRPNAGGHRGSAATLPGLAKLLLSATEPSRFAQPSVTGATRS